MTRGLVTSIDESQPIRPPTPYETQLGSGLEFVRCKVLPVLRGLDGPATPEDAVRYQLETVAQLRLKWEDELGRLEGQITELKRQKKELLRLRDLFEEIDPPWPLTTRADAEAASWVPYHEGWLKRNARDLSAINGLIRRVDRTIEEIATGKTKGSRGQAMYEYRPPDQNAGRNKEDALLNDILIYLHEEHGWEWVQIAEFLEWKKGIQRGRGRTPDKLFDRYRRMRARRLGR